jgi:hemolysin III
MIVAAPGVASRFVLAIYVFAIVGLFGISALYHRRSWGERGRIVMRRLDHSMIFVTIAATYTPIAVFALDQGTTRWILPTVWIGAALGIVSRLVWIAAPSPLIAAPYLALGWVAVAALPALLDGLGTAGFALIVSGGCLYSTGAVFYALRRPNPWPHWFGYHEIFHLFVIGGVALHYAAIAFYAVPKAT